MLNKKKPKWRQATLLSLERGHVSRERGRGQGRDALLLRLLSNIESCKDICQMPENFVYRSSSIIL